MALGLFIAVIVAVVAIGVLWCWLSDRRDHRRYLSQQGTTWGPEGARAAGEAWRSVAGDGPPALRWRSLGVSANTDPRGDLPRRGLPRRPVLPPRPPSEP
jgi:hypothetical protein